MVIPKLLFYAVTALAVSCPDGFFFFNDNNSQVELVKLMEESIPFGHEVDCLSK